MQNSGQNPSHQAGLNGGQKRGSKAGKSRNSSRGQAPREEPILIAARRPNSPAARPKRRFIAASATPRSSEGASNQVASRQAVVSVEGPQEPAMSLGRTPMEGDRRVRPRSENSSASTEDSGRHRAARIVQFQTAGPDDREKLRQKLIERLLRSEGRVAITRAARELEAAGFVFPNEQDVQLQLLEHFDETCAHQAICNLNQLLNEESPIKRPLFEQRLRRLEEFADDADIRRAAADLRRTVRA